MEELPKIKLRQKRQHWDDKTTSTLYARSSNQKFSKAMAGRTFEDAQVAAAKAAGRTFISRELNFSPIGCNLLCAGE
jgi:hypothetical protein